MSALTQKAILHLDSIISKASTQQGKDACRECLSPPDWISILPTHWIVKIAHWMSIPHLRLAKVAYNYNSPAQRCWQEESLKSVLSDRVLATLSTFLQELSVHPTQGILRQKPCPHLLPMVGLAASLNIACRPCFYRDFNVCIS